MFVKITHRVLVKLYMKGYNILKSTSEWGDESPTYRPATVDNIDEYLLKMQLQGELNGNEHFLSISEALDIPEVELFGVVWID